MVIILETLADYAKVTKDISFLIEKVRQSLARQICLQYVDENKAMQVITIDAALEQEIIDSRLETAGGLVAALPPERQRQWIASAVSTIQEVQNRNIFPLILCQEASRALVKESTRREIPDLVVLSVPEIIPEVKIEGIAEITIKQVIEQ